MSRTGNFIDLTGQTFGLLTVIEYSHTHPGGSYWLCECACGTVRAMASRHLREGNTTTCGLAGKHPDRPKNLNRYHVVHMNLRRKRGPAKALRCTDCGDVAREWSYSGTDPQGWSEDLTQYDPRCRECHLIHDGRAARSLVTA